MNDTRANQDRSCGTNALRTDTLTDSILILLGLTVVQRSIGFVRSILFCRWLAPEQLGEWDMALSFLMLAAPLCVLSLSGSFGRYVERYRQRRQLRTLLRRTAILCTCLAVPSMLLICVAKPWFSQLIFGTPGRTEVVAALAASVLAVIAMNYFIDLFNALRNVRLLAAMQLFHSLAFAVGATCLLWGWQCTALSAVIAYGVAAALSAAGAMLWLRRTWPAIPVDPGPPPPGELFSKLAPFAAWLMLASLLTNLFDVVDRYMIVHYSPFSAAEALALVGDYHSSRIVPLLLVSVALMLGAMITPHLSSDWEAGRRDRAGQRLNLFLKLLGFGLSAASVAVLCIAPLLFGVAFQGKFAGGRAVLPWTLTYCAWFGLTLVAHNYLLCAEKARLSSLAIAVGLVVNVALNMLLLPRLGLLGAVLATSAANLVALLLICAFNRLLGFPFDLGTGVALALPLAVCLGPWPALAVLIAVALEAVSSDRLLSADEKHQLVEGCSKYVERWRGMWPARGPAQRRST